MFASRVLPKLYNNISRTPVRNIASQWQGSAVCGPPVVRVTSAEKMGLGAAMFFINLIVPIYIMLHIDDYKKHS